MLGQTRSLKQTVLGKQTYTLPGKNLVLEVSKLIARRFAPLEIYQKTLLPAEAAAQDALVSAIQTRPNKPSNLFARFQTFVAENDLQNKETTN